MSNKFDECDTCSNQDTDPRICQGCYDAERFCPIDSDNAIQNTTMDDLRKIVFQKRNT